MLLVKAAGSTLFRPGDSCLGFVVVHSGCIRVSMISMSGREIVLYRVRPGDVCLQTFSCLAAGREYSAEGVVEADLAGELVSPDEFNRRLANEADFRAGILSAVARRFSDFEEVVETLAFAGLERRVAAALLRLANEANEIRATHEQIAAEIGSAREAVSRQLAAFARDGLVEGRRGYAVIIDRVAVSRLANADL